MNEEKIEGIVSAISQKADGKFALKIGENWINFVGLCPVDRGDNVKVKEIRVTSYGTWAKVEDIEVVKKADKSQMPKDTGIQTFADVLAVADFENLEHLIVEATDDKIRYQTIVEGKGRKVKIDQIIKKSSLIPKQQECFEQMARTLLLKKALVIYNGFEPVEEIIEDDKNAHE